MEQESDILNIYASDVVGFLDFRSMICACCRSISLEPVIVDDVDEHGDRTGKGLALVEDQSL